MNTEALKQIIELCGCSFNNAPSAIIEIGKIATAALSTHPQEAGEPPLRAGDFLKQHLGGNLNIANLTLLAWYKIMEAYASQFTSPSDAKGEVAMVNPTEIY
jgi:hypothetical protein